MQDEDYSDGPLIKQIIAYFNYKTPNLDPEFIKNMKKGTCYGSSIVLTEMYNHGKGEWWTTLRKKIIDAGNKITDPAFLQEKSSKDWNLPDTESSDQSHEQLIERLINYVLFPQGDIPKGEIPLDDDRYSQSTYL